MTYFTSRQQQADAITADLENLDNLGQPHLDPEDRRFVDESDVLNPDDTVVAGYGSDHRFILSFGRDDDPAWN